MHRNPPLGLDAVLLVGASCAFINLVSENAYKPEKSFYQLLGLVLLLLLAPLLARLLRATTLPSRATWLAAPVLFGVVVAFSWFHLYTFQEQVASPRNQRRLVDISQNTYEAGRMFFERGVNPYAFRAQIWHQIDDGPRVTRPSGKTAFFGLQYKYGYPYFPWMFFSYEPFRHLLSTYHSYRLANLLLMGLNLVGMLLLARRLCPAPDRTVAGLAMVAAFLGAKSLGYELYSFVITDIVIAVYLLFAALALERGRDVLAGVLTGLAQGCKLFPGALVSLVTLAWLKDPRRRVRFALAFALAVGLTVGPFLLADPEAFFSATFLFYLVRYPNGDDTAFSGTLPLGWRSVFRAMKWPLIGALVWLGFRRSRDDVTRLLVVSSASFLIFIAFHDMTHLNYVWAVWGPLCSALVLAYTRARTGSEGRQLRLPGIG
jgi:hypothetical protein